MSVHDTARAAAREVKARAREEATRDCQNDVERAKVLAYLALCDAFDTEQVAIVGQLAKVVADLNAKSSPEYDFIVACGGPAAAALWLARNRGRLEALLAGKSNPRHDKVIEAPFIAPEDLDHGNAAEAEQGPEEQGHARPTQGRGPSRGTDGR